MTRRLALAILVAVVAAPLADVRAQPPRKTYRIGWLSPVANPGNVEALRKGLGELGYADGTQFVIEPHYPGSAPALLARAAAALVQAQPDVIVTDGSAASLAVKQATTNVPIVFVSGDPVGAGLVPNLSRPGGNLTGFAVIGVELNVKRLELLREALPRLARVGIVYEGWQERTMIPPLEAQARGVGLQVTRLPVQASRDLDGAFELAAKERVGAVMPVASALFHAEKDKLVQLSARHRLSTMYENHVFPEAGGLMSYRPDVQEIHFVVNLDTARALGLTLPPRLLLRADRVIDGRR